MDLSSIDLSSEWFKSELGRLGWPSSLSWQAPYTWGNGLYGFNLEGAKLEGGNLRGANLTGVSLIRANLRGVDLTDAQLVGANLWRADLSDATLMRANLREAAATETNFAGAYLYRTELSDAVLIRANLEYAYLDSATLGASNLTDARIGKKLVHEDARLLHGLLQRLAIAYGFDVDWYVRRRHRTASSIYNEIKNSYLRHGQDQAASDAHFRERQMQRKARNPFIARYTYEELWPTAGPLRGLRRMLFFLRFVVSWTLDVFGEMVLGYGEKPLRVLITAIMCVSLFSILYRLMPGTSLGVYDPTTLQYIQSGHQLDYVIYSLSAFLLYEFPGSIVPIGAGAKLLTALEGSLGVSLLALLMYALGNRMTR